MEELMIFADKIIDLRKKNGWSQKNLAEALGVSRQTISKWESSTSVPDFNRLIQISELFGVSTDYLLKDSIEEIEPAPKMKTISQNEETIKSVSMEIANDFLNYKSSSAGKIAFGVFLCIISPLLFVVFDPLFEMGVLTISKNIGEAMAGIFLFSLVAIAVFIFVFEAIKGKPFEFLEKEPIETAYGVSGMVKGKKEKYRKTHSLYISLGTMLCVLSVIPIFIGEIVSEEAEDLAVALLLLLVSFGIMLIVKCSIIWGSFQILLEESDYSKAKKEENKKNSLIAIIYWLTVTAVYLAYNFLTFKWDTSWVIWPIAGISYGILTSVLKIIRKENL